MPDNMTMVALQQMKRDGRKIAGIAAWDKPMAKIADPPDAVALNMASVCSSWRLR
jgi:ketopantoate hydroxymethyltransferase